MSAIRGRLAFIKTKESKDFQSSNQENDNSKCERKVRSVSHFSEVETRRKLENPSNIGDKLDKSIKQKSTNNYFSHSWNEIPLVSLKQSEIIILKHTWKDVRNNMVELGVELLLLYALSCLNVCNFNL